MHVDPTRTPILRRRAKEFIEQYLGQFDRAVVVQIGYPSGALKFTSDSAALVAEIDRAIGERLPSAAVASANTVSGNGDRNGSLRRYMAERSVVELAGIADSLTTVEAPRKSLVLFSEGLDVDVQEPGNSELLEQVRNLYASAARANVTIYTVDPRGVASVADDLIQVGIMRQGATPPTTALYREQRIAQNSLRNFADQTGGFAWVGSGDFARGFKQIVDDNSTYYLIGYYSSNARRDGKFRSIKVHVNRQGATVRVRKGYYMPKR
jgi:VWFA-related protein